MRVRKSVDGGDPKYPSRGQIKDYGLALGAAAIGLGAVAAWGEPQRTAGVPMRTAGKIVAEPQPGAAGGGTVATNKPVEPTRLRGDIAETCTPASASWGPTRTRTCESATSSPASMRGGGGRFWNAGGMKSRSAGAARSATGA